MRRLRPLLLRTTFGEAEARAAARGAPAAFAAPLRGSRTGWWPCRGSVQACVPQVNIMVAVPFRTELIVALENPEVLGEGSLVVAQRLDAAGENDVAGVQDDDVVGEVE